MNMIWFQIDNDNYEGKNTDRSIFIGKPLKYGDTILYSVDYLYSLILWQRQEPNGVILTLY